MKSRRLFWSIVEKLEDLIDQGVCPAGSRLPAERELAETYKVSRPTIREAIIALEVRERVEVKTGSGVYVLKQKKNQHTAKAISAFELTQARALIEGEAAALAASTISDEEISALQTSLTEMAAPETADSADQRFHHIISQATHNHAVQLSVENLWELRRSTPQIVAAYSDVCSQGIEQRIREHTEIFNAIANRDTAAARKAMHSHFNRLINALFDASEARELEEIRRKTDKTRGLYSISHLSKP
ncbi:FadR/GntR family transcriptional regulator [Alteromonas sp. 1_MG-2023]|uniref:FadR/GntR family transcriptional regulator n=1 Tax=Alteromonas sp. 1_MG-2023 TaxID=3062669 RepID=UPI0026E25057|nr:FadR/GntR family transcriptional regulator [Alteromonas sp. 1_MG-2023]MDO6567375.1 FadR/GntR family transcriptional regulator [Alteromonas sp. 1_MG-2023]